MEERKEKCPEKGRTMNILSYSTNTTSDKNILAVDFLINGGAMSPADYEYFYQKLNSLCQQINQEVQHRYENDPFKRQFQDTAEKIMRENKATFICWKEKNSEKHCFHAVTSEELIELMTHLIFCHSKCSPYNWQPLGIIEKLTDAKKQN